MSQDETVSDPFAGPYTWRERWALLKARVALGLCESDIRSCRTCRPPQSGINTYTDNSGGTPGVPPGRGRAT